MSHTRPFRLRQRLLYACLILAAIFSAPCQVLAADTGETAAATEQGNKQDSISIVQSFSKDEAKKSEIVQITDKEKAAIMFYMGVPLIIMLLITVSLGVAMVVYQKRVFVAHMIFAGFSLTLALAHAVVGTVWFYPF